MIPSDIEIVKILEGSETGNVLTPMNRKKETWKHSFLSNFDLESANIVEDSKPQSFCHAVHDCLFSLKDYPVW